MTHTEFPDEMGPFDRIDHGWEPVDVPLDQIQHSMDVQAREKEDPETANEYAEILKEGGVFPPIHLFRDEECGCFWIVDGNHRYLAAKMSGKGSISAYVTEGDITDARLHACRANRTNGLSRTRADKRQAVNRVIDSPIAADWSARKIARFVGVSNRFVSNVINERADEIAGVDDGTAGDADMSLTDEQVDEVREEETENEKQELKQVLEVQVDTTQSPDRIAEQVWLSAVKHNVDSPRDVLAAWFSTFAQRLRALAFEVLADDAEPGPGGRGA
ncbi:MAG: ParB-like nuclease domain-containing protein [Thermoguttaceae bacterium]|nr:ParB-like nuclease domain-containing protein [Thermoguttaceae bacterium]